MKTPKMNCFVKGIPNQCAVINPQNKSVLANQNGENSMHTKVMGKNFRKLLENCHPGQSFQKVSISVT